MCFCSLWGILAGITASPGLFTSEVDNLVMSDRPISDTKDADDVVLREARALQKKFDQPTVLSSQVVELFLGHDESLVADGEPVGDSSMGV